VRLKPRLRFGRTPRIGATTWPSSRDLGEQVGPRYVRSGSDLPDHDVILWLPGVLTGRVGCHARHYVHDDRHVVVVGRLDDGGVDPICDAVEVGRHVAETVVPEEQEFVLVAYVPQPPLSREPRFHEVTFEVGGRVTTPSLAALEGPTLALPRFRPLDLDDVEALAGRPVLTFPYSSYTTALAEATNGQPAKRLFDLLVEAGVGCPRHGPSTDGAYCCRFDPRCEAKHRRSARVWGEPHEPRRRCYGGTYVGDRREGWARIEWDLDGRRSPIPVFGLAAPGVEWGYRGSGAQEGATALLADYLGFLPRPELRARFEEDVVSQLPRGEFALPVSELDAWYRRMHEAWERGLVVVAGPVSSCWPTGRTHGMASSIARGLMQLRLDVYEPGRNAETGRWRRSDHGLSGRLHASLLRALDASSMIVVPYDGEAILQPAESTIALRHAIERTRVPVVIAYDRVERQGLDRYERLGFRLAKVDTTTPSYDVGAVVEAVDGVCAAYECFEPSPEDPRESNR
jgi:hypothetical protein